MFTLAIMASLPFFVYRPYWLFTRTLLMRSAYSSSHSSRLRQVNKASPQARALVEPACKHWHTCLHADKHTHSVLLFISDVNRDTRGWPFHLFCSNLHRQLSMVPMTGSQQRGGRLLPAPLFYFRPETHGKAILRPFPVGLRKQCQWFVNRCNVARRIFKIALFLPNSFA